MQMMIRATRAIPDAKQPDDSSLDERKYVGGPTCRASCRITAGKACVRVPCDQLPITHAAYGPIGNAHLHGQGHG